MAASILITGATSGIGAACAETFAARGWKLLLAARRTDRLDAARRRLGDAHGVEVLTWTLDVRDRRAVEAWAREAGPHLTTLDVLVNNAGLARGLASVHDGDPDDWDEMIDTNVKGLLYVTRAVTPHLVVRACGDVVNVGSVAGRWVYPKGAAYCASKFAVRALTEGLRLDLNGTGVRVTTVDPGLVETEFSLVRFHGDADKAMKPYAGLTPLSAQDVAETIAWVVERPRHVNVAEVVLYPTDQASPTVAHRRLKKVARPDDMP
jgi:NADP-dependent 3-hydroxy acid dehydrogenase YdfG